MILELRRDSHWCGLVQHLDESIVLVCSVNKCHIRNVLGTPCCLPSDTSWSACWTHLSLEKKRNFFLFFNCFLSITCLVWPVGNFMPIVWYILCGAKRRYGVRLRMYFHKYNLRCTMVLTCMWCICKKTNMDFSKFFFELIFRIRWMMKKNLTKEVLAETLRVFEHVHATMHERHNQAATHRFSGVCWSSKAKSLALCFLQCIAQTKVLARRSCREEDSVGQRAAQLLFAAVCTCKVRAYFMHTHRISTNIYVICKKGACMLHLNRSSAQKKAMHRTQCEWSMHALVHFFISLRIKYENGSGPTAINAVSQFAL